MQNVRIAVRNGKHHLAVKQECVLPKNLSNFTVVIGYAPDIPHDIFEGVVPFKLSF